MEEHRCLGEMFSLIRDNNVTITLSYSSDYGAYLLEVKDRFDATNSYKEKNWIDENDIDTVKGVFIDVLERLIDDIKISREEGDTW